MHLKLNMDFDDMAFAHMLKDYSVFSFPGLVMQFRTVFFFDAVVYRPYALRIITSVGWKQELCGMQSCVELKVIPSHLHRLVQSAVSLFLVSLSSGVSAPRSRVLFHCKVACLSLTV